MASECLESLKTVKYVSKCPLGVSEWNERARLKQCSEITHGTCNYGKKLVYHCLPNAYRDKLIEVCAPPTYIPRDTCPEYSIQGKRINGVYNCSRNIRHSCPTKQYSSINLTNYPDCLKINEIQQSTSTTIDIGEIVVIVSVVLLLLIFSIFLYCKYRKSKVKNFRNFLNRCIPCRKCREPILMENGFCENHEEEEQEEENKQAEYNEVRILLVGKTGTGKSSTGNSILKRYAFVSELSSSSVTNVCKKEECILNSSRLHIIDTPGLFDTERKNIDYFNEMKKLCSPGPHAVVIVLKATAIEKSDVKTLQMIQKYFGDKLLKYAIVLFTFKDELDRNNKSLDSFLSGPGKYTKEVKKFIAKCNNRYLAFDNTLGGIQKNFDDSSDDSRKNDNQVMALLNTVSKNKSKGTDVFLELR